ncbi:hypothetical protein BRADI_4g26354v3 [Brachypodium distachyon]|uniref:Major facilitator superfamily (MFS) profile domain-containing protein n=1 Tax=Brachypodium distachyon TaxID=15368 RepID=A0A2K2CQF9_BRADI|nr:hypothetical protein BRADI_4g26354v3 [Brachypodium distachyon]
MAAAGDEAAAPLLETEEKAAAAYREGCPGCAVDRRKALNAGVPYREFFHIWIIILVSCLSISSLFPFLYFMIMTRFVCTHTSRNNDQYGFLLILLGAAYMLGRALTSTGWGVIADRIGRKPVIVFGIFSALLFNTLFGLSVNYWMAISTRFLIGSLNGLIGPIRAYAIEICRPEHQAIALSLVSTSWAIGLIIGPTIGGYLAQVPENYSDVIVFPYFLPSLCISFFCFVILISCIWLPETLHNHKADKMGDQTSESSISHLSDPEELNEHGTSATTDQNLFKNWPLMSSIILFCIMSFEDMAYTEIFSLWAESDRKYGGLSFSTEDVGQVLAISGASIFAYQIFIYPRILGVVGPIKASRIATSLSMVLILTYAPITYLSRPWSQIAVTIASILKNNFVVSTFRFILSFYACVNIGGYPRSTFLMFIFALK